MVATNMALDFDGTNDHVTLGPAANFNDNTYTVETWFRRDGTGTPVLTASTGGLNAIPLVTKGRSGGGVINWFLGIDNATNRIAADFESEIDDSNHPLIGTTTLVTGTWYHAAITYSGSTFRLYLNGVEEANVSIANGPGTASNHAPALGTALDPAGAPLGRFNGVLDEVRIWDINRSAALILANRDLELTSGTGLVARYGMNEGTGTAVGNSVAGAPVNGNGVAVNGPLWVAGFPGADTTPPPVPTGLSAAPGTNLVSLTWNAVSAPDLAGYRVFRGTSLPVATTGNGLQRGAPDRHQLHSTRPPSTAPPTSTWSSSVDATGNRSAASAAAAVTPSVAAGAAVDLDGTNDYVTFGPRRRR